MEITRVLKDTMLLRSRNKLRIYRHRCCQQELRERLSQEEILEGATVVVGLAEVEEDMEVVVAEDGVGVEVDLVEAQKFISIKFTRIP